MAVHLSTTHKGNISELLADFLLSLLGVANPPRRQFDDGYDFYCNISTETSGLLTFDSPYMIQIKSSNPFEVQYGKSFNKWKSEDIAWLFRHEIPFFLGFIDLKSNSLSIYDTTGIWFLFGQLNINCSQILFKPNNREKGIRRKTPEKTELKNWGNDRAKGDGFKYEIDLGNPIINISVSDFGNEEILQKKRELLRLFVNIERENIINRNLGINFFQEIKQNTTNEIYPIEKGIQILDNYDQQYISKIYDSIKFTLISLSMNLNSHGRIEECNAVKNLIKFIPQDGLYKDLHDQNPDLSNWLQKIG